MYYMNNLRRVAEGCFLFLNKSCELAIVLESNLYTYFCKFWPGCPRNKRGGKSSSPDATESCRNSPSSFTKNPSKFVCNEAWMYLFPTLLQRGKKKKKSLVLILQTCSESCAYQIFPINWLNLSSIADSSICFEKC